MNQKTIPDQYLLWDGQEKPHSKANALVETELEIWGTRAVFNVTEPALSIYRAKGVNTGIGVVVIPGGDYKFGAIYHEGHDIARSLASAGFTAGVLKYRLPDPKTSDQPQLVPLADARRALKLLHQMSAAYGIHRKIGLLGFSAGSHLATLACLHKSRHPQENPDFAGLIYGVTTLSDDNRKWLEESLYFRPLTADEIAQNRLLDWVTSETPPAFLVHAYDDQVCSVEESLLYAQKLFERRVPVEMHLFNAGGHGFGLGRKEDGTDQWIRLFTNWAYLL